MEAERVEVTPASRNFFSRQQKAGYAVIICCGSLAVVLGFLYIGRHLNAPFQISYTGDRVLTSDQQEAEQIRMQKAADTDGDTINDYDELYVYKSSPYLTDSDSDGISDDLEINSGGDPACATGDACQNTLDDVNNDTGFISEYADQSAAQAAAAAAEIDKMKAALSDVTAAEIRAMLVESGATQAEVDVMTDDDVTALYQQIIAQLETSGQLGQMLSGTSSSAPSSQTTP